MASGAKKIEDTKPIKAHSSAIQVTHKLTLVQHKAWLVLLRNAYHELANNNIKKHKMRMQELALYLGYTNNRNDKYLKNVLEELVDTKVAWNVFDKDGEDEWGVAAMLAGCKVKKGVVEYDYSSFLREKLYNPKMFALLNLKILNKFRSKYALAIYNLCKDYVGAGQAPLVGLDKFREFVGLDTGEYTDFKSMNRRVIKEPLKEINALSDINVKVDYIKEKRKVVGLKFMIRANPQLSLDIDSVTEKVMGQPSEFDEDMDAPPDKANRAGAVVDRLVSFGVTEKQARKLSESHEYGYIMENLDVVEKQCRSGRVQNVPAYTVTAIREDYRPRKTFIQAEMAAKEAEKKKARTKKAREEILKRLLDEFDAKSLEKAIHVLKPKEKEKLQGDFLQHVRGESFLSQYYARNGFENMVVKGAYFAFAKERLGIPRPGAQSLVKMLESAGYRATEFKEELSLYE
ncbi:MAG: replication initiation protein [Nitrospinae bacterium]|nr:replication initiation protein [Nitrospinota bacterium]